MNTKAFLSGLWFFLGLFLAPVGLAAATVFDAPGAKVAVDTFEAKFTAMQSNLGVANTGLQSLKTKMDAASTGQYASNAAVITALAAAQTTYDELSAKLLTAPKQTDLDALKTALQKYTEAAGAQPIIQGLQDQVAATQRAFDILVPAINSANTALPAAWASMPAEFKTN